MMFAAAAAACLVSIAVAKPAEAPDTIAGQWIVELEAPPTAVFEGGPMIDRSGNRAVTREMEATAPAVTGAQKLDVQSRAAIEYVDYLDAQRDAVLAEAAGLLGRAVAPRHVYHHTFNGFSVSMDAEAAKRLAEIPGVKSVQPDTIHRMHNDAGYLWMRANLVWNGTGGLPGGPNRGEGMIGGVIDSGINWDSPYFADTLGGMTPIQNPRPGTVGLCSDPEVQCNNKLIGVYDFTSEGTKGKDPDGHGSHVASSMVGNPVSWQADFGTGTPVVFNTSGVAPQANLMSYKVCYDEHPTDPELDGRCEGSAILSAINQAVSNQVDVVNYSIGGEPTSPWNNQIATSFRNLRSAGIVPVTSAGNNGPGSSTVANPAHAPWMVAVANATHDRRLTNRLVDASGGPFALGELIGEGVTPGTSIRQIVHAADFGNALCGTGEPELGPACNDNTGASNPFAPGTFSGQIVVCDRGTYGRVEKGRNVQIAGAGGMILANTDETGESTNADEHCIPATHVGDEDGDRLRQWLDSGAGHQGRLTGTQRQLSSDFGGLLAASSSRGPGANVPDVMKPNVTAPGTAILGASSGDNPAFLTGTSMASPHVAGAALLVRKAHPNWSVSAVISALETTSRTDLVTEADGSDADMTGRGAGGVQVDSAIRARLELPVSTQQFIDANPSTGGDPGQLNLPGISSESCTDDCAFTRTVRALATGTWNVSTEGELDIDVQPGSFSLQPGESQQLSITVSRGSTPSGTWGSGAVVLDNTGTGATQRLPVGLFVTAGSVPTQWNINASRNRGEDSVTLHQLGELPEAVFRTSALVKPDRTVVSLAQDPSPNNPFSGGTGTHSFLIDVPVNTLKIYAETLESTANDIDLFIGLDINGNGQPDESELACASVSLDELETCEINEPVAGSWWVLIQNWEASSPSASDDVTLDVAVLTAGNDPSFVAYGPGKHAGGSLTIPVFWDQPAMGLNERWLAALAVSTSPDHLANVGVTRMNVTRGNLNLPQNTVLFNGEPRPVHLPQNNVHDKLYIDVPPGASALEVDIDGPVINASLRRRDFEDIAGFEPDTPPAPAAVITSGNNNGSGLTMNISGGIAAGRYYVVLDNGSSSEEMVTVTATYTEGARNELVRGLYSPALRSTGQGIEWNGGADDNAYILWYTYDDDGVPVFYITDLAEVSDDTSFWTTEILRATTGDGVRQTLVGVGEAGITALDSENLIYSWRYNGRHGSEWLDLVTVNRCAEIDGQPMHLLATWTIQGAREGGASVLINDFTEAWIRYYFDALGVGRWVQHATVAETPPNSGSHNTAVNEMSVLDFRGFCPYCNDTGFGYEVVGTVEREFFDELSGMESVEFTSRPPLNQDYSATRTMGRLSQVLGCQ